MANGNNATIGFEKQIWMLRVSFGGISPQQNTEKRRYKNWSSRQM